MSNMWGTKKPTKPVKGTIVWKNFVQTEHPKKALTLVWKNRDIEARITNLPRPTKLEKLPQASEKLVERLTVGHYVFVFHDLQFGAKGLHPFATLEKYRASRRTPVGVVIPKGTMIIYAGTIDSIEGRRPRSELERLNFKGRTLRVSVVKHTFITSVGRCIISDFALIRAM